ncbi:hypothetical protein ACWGE0_35380 [Lentzea sp. NPDC054927]
MPEGFDLRDRRSFSLIDYRHGHGYALFRGFPEIDADLPGGAPLQVLDLLFAGIGRLSCWKDVGDIHLREATVSQRTELEARIGGFRVGQRVFLLRPGSVEEYVVSYDLEWAEFELPGGARSPLVSEDSEYRKAYPPAKGVIYTA